MRTIKPSYHLTVSLSMTNKNFFKWISLIFQGESNDNISNWFISDENERTHMCTPKPVRFGLTYLLLQGCHDKLVSSDFQCIFMPFLETFPQCIEVAPLTVSSWYLWMGLKLLPKSEASSKLKVDAQYVSQKVSQSIGLSERPPVRLRVTSYD